MADYPAGKHFLKHIKNSDMDDQVMPQQILEKVNNLAYSDISCYELLSIGNEAYSSIPGHDAKESNIRVKTQIRHIWDQQIRPLVDGELLVEERKVLFMDAKEKLASLLKEYLATGQVLPYIHG